LSSHWGGQTIVAGDDSPFPEQMAINILVPRTYTVTEYKGMMDRDAPDVRRHDDYDHHDQVCRK